MAAVGPKGVPSVEKAVQNCVAAIIEERPKRHYRNQNWDETEKILQELLVIEPDSFLFKLYLERIVIFREEPPGDDWDGVFVYKTK